MSKFLKIIPGPCTAMLKQILEQANSLIEDKMYPQQVVKVGAYISYLAVSPGKSDNFVEISIYICICHTDQFYGIIHC